MIDALIEEAILALRMAGAFIPKYEVLEDGVVYFYYGQKEDHPSISSEEPRGEVG